MHHPTWPSPRLVVGVAILLSLGGSSAPAGPSSAAPVQDRFAIPATDDGLPGAGPIRRYDWFRKLWRERRTAWAARVAQDQGAVVFLGDSITQGWGDDFGARVPRHEGRQSRHQRRHDARRAHPAGGRRARAGPAARRAAHRHERPGGKARRPRSIAGNVKLILAALKQHDAKMPIVLCQVFPSSATKKRPAGQDQEGERAVCRRP